MNNRVVVAAIIIKDNKYLLGKKLPNVGPYPNTWLIIGGGVNLDEESLEDGLKREIKEEANIEITDIRQIYFDEDYEMHAQTGEMIHYVFLIYQSKYKSGEIKPGDDIHEIKLFTKEELKSIPLSRPTIKLFKFLKII